MCFAIGDDALGFDRADARQGIQFLDGGGIDIDRWQVSGCYRSELGMRVGSPMSWDVHLVAIK